ncbi:ABC transporter permease [uncultured Fretibacterium sp.]|uniref:ABC transporter permease n=1 Tax=uncultured Fretibacterium sp. TaxID=1678694 RepID=UPI0026088988|nr:ABC transporter permease [uncultured Fretibacterium sp.]
MPRMSQPFWVGLALLGFAALFAFLSPHFWSLGNLRSIAEQSSINLIAAVGMTFVVASAGIDLSSGAVVALSGVVMALSLREGWGVGVTIGLGLGTGALIGLANALLVVRARITPFMATLTTMNLIAGATLILTQGIPIYGFSARFAWLGRGSVAGVPVSAAAAAVFTVIGVLALRTRLGVYALALGGNEEALRRSGVPADLYKGALYVFSGICASAASVIMTAKLNSAEPLAGTMMEMNAIATVVLGGTRLQGGFASITGTLLAGLLLGVIRNGLVLIGVSSYYQQFVTGAILLTAVLFSEGKR